MTAITKLGAFGSSFSKMNTGRYDGKTIATAFQTAILIWQFDLWREGYAGAVVEIFKEGTTTHADIYSDINLTTPVSNPQVLITETLNTRTFGKFVVSLYTPDSYYMVINGIETTGVFSRGIRVLDGENATEADITSDLGGVARSAGQRAGDTIHVQDFGSFLEVDGSTTENTTTLTAALGVAAAANGGEVILPAGTYKISSIELPADVILRGQGRNATILQSEEDDFVVTVTGSNAGMADMTLDGINLEPGSVGVYCVGQDQLRFSEFMIKRFECGLKVLGGSDHHYANFYIDNCTTGAELRGDTDASSTALGAAFNGLKWDGGAVTESTLYGLWLRYVDAAISGLTIRDVDLTDNVGTAALYINGAEQLIFQDLDFVGNIVRHILTADATANTVKNVEFKSCEFTDHEIKLGGACKDTIFDRCLMSGTLSLNLNNNDYPVLFSDAVEAATVTQTGATDKISRWKSIDAGVFVGQTITTVTTVTVFKRILEPGEVVDMTVAASAVQTNQASFFSMRRTAVAIGVAAALPFDTQTVNFTAGNTITGGTSGATGVLQSQTDAGATGSLNLIRVTGTFVNNEALTGSGGGAALVDGVIAYQNSVVLPPVSTDHYSGSGTGVSSWNVDVTTSGREVQVKVTGPTTGTVDWNVMVMQNDRP